MNNSVYIICEDELGNYLYNNIKEKKIIKVTNLFDIEDIKKNIDNIDVIYIQSSIYYSKIELDELLVENPHIYYYHIPSINEMLGSATSEKIDNLNYEACFGKKEKNILADYEHNNEIEGKIVLVAGAAGSIGSEITKQLFKLNPKKVILLDINENRLYFLELFLKAQFITNIEVVSGNIQDYQRMEEIFTMFKPDVLFHAAASKHVPLSEMNPSETIKNNVIGTYNLFKLASLHNIDRAVLISTDKAVNPTNVMGATKRLAEIIISNIKYKDTKVCAVRFGNVFASEGSLLLIFQEQLKNKRPLTVTHREVTRYFMSIQEAAQLVIVAGIIQEKNDLFVLDMGEPIRIYDLAEKIIELVGLNVGIDVVGLRPGEKLYEELIYDSDNSIKTKNEKIYVSKGEFNVEIDVENLIKQYSNIVYSGDRTKCIDQLKIDVTTFRHNKNY